MLFQFLLVRLKEFKRIFSILVGFISIPSGTIKRLPKGLTSAVGHNFQFLLVRLKVHLFYYSATP